MPSSLLPPGHTELLACGAESQSRLFIAVWVQLAQAGLVEPLACLNRSMAVIEFPEPGLWDYFRARHIATDISDAFCVGQNDSGITARSRLKEGRFDQAPVVSEAPHIVGWVAIDQLRDRGTVESVMTSLDKSAIVSTESPIAHVLELLDQHGLVFTVGNDGLAGFIVHSDLDRQPARTHFYLLVAGVEILLSDIVRNAQSADSIVGAMGPAMARQYERARKSNNETHPVEYLYLTALVRLFLELPHVRETNVLDKASVEWLNTLNKFRRLVMHPAGSIATARTATEIAEFTLIAVNVIERLQVISKEFHAAPN